MNLSRKIVPFLILCILQAGDLLSTRMGMTVPGVVELNPLVRVVRVMAGQAAGVRTDCIAGVADEKNAAAVDVVRNLCFHRRFQCAVICHPCLSLGAAAKLNNALKRNA